MYVYEHVIQPHRFVSCDKCEYLAADYVIMKKHQQKHTVSFVFNCGVCQFVATMSTILEEHFNVSILNKTPWLHENANQNSTISL